MCGKILCLKIIACIILFTSQLLYLFYMIHKNFSYEGVEKQVIN